MAIKLLTYILPLSLTTSSPFTTFDFDASAKLLLKCKYNSDNKITEIYFMAFACVYYVGKNYKNILKIK